MTVSIMRRGALLAVALGLAGPAAGQQPTPSGTMPGTVGTKRSTPPQQQPSTTAPAPAPAASSAPPGAAAQTGATLDDRQKQVLGTIHTRHMNMVDASKLAAEKASTEEVKQLGRDLEAEIRRVDDEMKAIVASRGSHVDALPVQQSERSREQERWASLRNQSGAEFDRQYVLALRELYGGYVDDLKRMRDETPGKDAELKGWLDHAENVAEERLTAIRRVKQSQDAQRAAQK